MSDISKQTISFLASFKIFFFNILIFLLFGIVFLFLAQSICGESTICGFIRSANPSLFDLTKVDFSTPENTTRTLTFSYILGLLLWAFARLCFSRRLRRFFDHDTLDNTKKGTEKMPTGDVDIYIFLGKKDNSLVADVHFLNLFQSSIVRLLFAIITLSVIFFAPMTHLIFLLGVGSIIILLFVLNITTDREVNAFGQQIRNRIKKDNKVKGQQ